MTRKHEFGVVAQNPPPGRFGVIGKVFQHLPALPVGEELRDAVRRVIVSTEDQEHFLPARARNFLHETVHEFVLIIHDDVPGRAFNHIYVRRRVVFLAHSAPRSVVASSAPPSVRA